LEIAKAGPAPHVVLEATYGWYWAVDVLQACGAQVHLAHPLGVKGFAYRRVKNAAHDAAELVDLLRMDLRGSQTRYVRCSPSAWRGHTLLPDPATAGHPDNRGIGKLVERGGHTVYR
jgi:hypothetical protein